jgi:hypothetical protein
MVTIGNARKEALLLPETEEHSHFGKPDFRVRKKIFSSIHEEKKLMMVKLSLLDQSVFCAFDPAIIYPVPGGWGRQGATFINLQKIKKPMLVDALTTAWKNVAPTKLFEKYFSNEKK